jgi:hypothetical protein
MSEEDLYINHQKDLLNMHELQTSASNTIQRINTSFNNQREKDLSLMIKLRKGSISNGQAKSLAATLK